MTAHSPTRVSIALCLVVGFAGCAQHPVARNTEPYRIDIGDDVVTISNADAQGIPVVDFIKAGQMVTGKVFTYSREAVANADGIRVTGKMMVKRKEFFAFFQTMLRVNGFGCASRGEGDSEVVEIKRLPGGHP